MMFLNYVYKDHNIEKQGYFLYALQTTQFCMCVLISFKCWVFYSQFWCNSYELGIIFTVHFECVIAQCHLGHLNSFLKFRYTQNAFI